MPLILPTTGPTGALPAAPANVFQALQGQSAPNTTGSPPTPPFPNLNNIYWLLVPGATSYNVYRGLNGATPSIYATGITATGTSPYGATVGIFQDTAATLNVSGTAGAGPEYYIANFYQYQVTAVNAVGEGPRSPTQTCIYYANGVQDHTGGDFNTGCTTNYNQTSGPQDGAHTACAQCTITSAFGIWLPWSGNNAVEWNLPIGAYGYLQLDVYALQSGSTLQFACHRVGDVVIENRSGSQLFAQSTAYGTLTANTWVTLKIPLGDLLSDWTSGSPTLQRAFYKVNIQTNSGTPGEVFRFDNVIFTPGPLTTGPQFDFYISPTGDDSNPGTTLSSPWSITALNSKGATYAGKRVGLMPGTYQYGTSSGVQTSIYTICQAQSGGIQAALNIYGNVGGTPTFVSSCDTLGNYSARTAVIFPADISTGNRPSQGAVIGQGYQAVPLANRGNFTLDGVVIHFAYQAAVYCYPQLNTTYPYTGSTLNLNVRFQNMEIYDIAGFENDNMGGFYLQGLIGAYVGNCKVYDIVPSSGAGIDCAGLFSFNCRSNLYEFNTIFASGCGIYDKNVNNGNHTHRYNLIESTNQFGAQTNANMEDCMGGLSGDVMTSHNNILFGGPWSGASATNNPAGTAINFYNNTCIYNSNGGPGLFLPQNTGNVSIYNNIIVDLVHTTNGLTCVVLNGSYVLGAYNVYDDLTHAPSFASNTTPAAGGPANFYSTLALFRTATGQDSTSAVLTPVFAGSFGVQSAANYKLQSGSPGLGFGHVGGVSGGASVNAGAWDGVVTVIGSNF